MSNGKSKVSMAAAKAKPMPAGRRRTKVSPVAQTARTDRTDIDPEMLARLQAAADMPDDRIDLTDPDAPLVTDWRGAVQGKFFKPVKRLKSFRIDADVLAYFESHGKGYQAMVNRVLREAMQRDMSGATVSKSAARRNAEKA